MCWLQADAIMQLQSMSENDNCGLWHVEKVEISTYMGGRMPV